MFRKRAYVAPLACLFIFAASGVSTGDDAVSLPMRKAGLWELKTVMDEGNGPRDQTLKMCIDETMERNTVKASTEEHKLNCASYNVKKDASSQTVVDAECTFNARKVVSTTVMSGDFNSAFEVKIDSTTSDPKAKEQSIVIKRTIKQTGKYLGAACGELKPGEAEGTDGKRIMVQ